MVIKRNGEEIQLTEEELYAAYLEQQHIFDKANVINELETTVDRGCEEEKAAEAILASDEKISFIARQVRRCHEHDGCSYEYAVESCVSDAVADECDKLGAEGEVAPNVRKKMHGM